MIDAQPDVGGVVVGPEHVVHVEDDGLARAQRGGGRGLVHVREEPTPGRAGGPVGGGRGSRSPHGGGTVVLSGDLGDLRGGVLGGKGLVQVLLLF